MWGQAASLALPRLRPPRRSMRQFYDSLPVDQSDPRLSQCTLCTSSPNQFSVSSTRGELNEFGVGLFSFSSLNNFFSKVDLLPKSLQNLLFQSVGTKQPPSKRELKSALQVELSDNIKQLIPWRKTLMTHKF